MMIRSASVAGIKRALARPSLILLIYAIGLALAALLAVPIYRTVELLFGASGFSSDLANRFDVVLWADMLEKGSAAISASARQFVWAIPLFIIWKTASHVGLIHALRGDGRGSFWEGVSRFTLRALPIALVYLVLAVIALTILWVVLAAIMRSSGEAGTYWISLVVGPLLSAMAIAQLDVMHDYARIHLVLRGGIGRSLIRGSIWPLKRLSALVMYDIWYFVAAVLWVLPFALDYATAKVTIAGMIGTFMLQQVAVFARQAVFVGWIGSEVAYFEERAEPEPEAEPEDVDEQRDGAETAEQPTSGT